VETALPLSPTQDAEDDATFFKESRSLGSETVVAVCNIVHNTKNQYEKPQSFSMEAYTQR
jgi:ABC-type xylose transport system substrate-binding protein